MKLVVEIALEKGAIADDPEELPRLIRELADSLHEGGYDLCFDHTLRDSRGNEVGHVIIGR